MPISVAVPTPIFGFRECFSDLITRWVALGSSHSGNYLVLVVAASLSYLSRLASLFLLFGYLGLPFLAFLIPQLAVNLTPAIGKPGQLGQCRPGGIRLPGLHTDRPMDTFLKATLQQGMRMKKSENIVELANTFC